VEPYTEGRKVIKRILFIDDEQRILDSLARMLRGMHGEWEMRFVNSVDRALEVMSEWEVDAVVSDVKMPGKDGFDFLRLHRENDRVSDVPVLILTGCGERGMKREALDLGATDLLGKPVDREELVARIKSILRLKAYQDKIKQDRETLEERVSQRTAELERSRVEMIWRLGKAGEFRDTDTGNHVVRVGYYSLELANVLGLGADIARNIFITAPLHDLGKIATPDSILLKPGKLTPQEWSVMKQHTRIGAEILRSNVFGSGRSEVLGDVLFTSESRIFENDALTEMGASIALNHHEQWSGGGYPNGLKGEEIPIEARIVSLADVFDALCSKRSYKPALAEDEVLSIMRGGVGTQFDPEAFDAFERSLDAFRQIAGEFADHGDEGGSKAWWGLGAA
jgi:putative two-component system response regulator